MSKPRTYSQALNHATVKASKAPRLLFNALLESYGLPIPEAEFHFAKPRKWRFDYAWPALKLALEVQGGIWTAGRHVRGEALLEEWEKLNTAACLGWRILYRQPAALATLDTVRLVGAGLAGFPLDTVTQTITPA